MENAIHGDNTPEEKAKAVKAWIYRLLADVEVTDIDHASESVYGDTITISVVFKRN